VAPRYLPYFLAESVEMSGIVGTLFAGITTRHYAHVNLSPASQETAIFIFKLAAYATETCVFLDLGLSVFRLDYRDDYHGSLIFWAVLLCLLGRAIHVYPLSHLLNRSRREHHGCIEPNKQHMLWFSGLRGAVAFACAQVFPDANGHREVFLITTMMIVLLTVFTMGCATVPVLELLDISTGVDEDDFGAPPPSPSTMAVLEFDRRRACSDSAPAEGAATYKCLWICLSGARPFRWIMPLLTNYRPGGEWIREQHRRAIAQEEALLREGGRGGGSQSLRSPSHGRESEEGDSLVLQPLSAPVAAAVRSRSRDSSTEESRVAVEGSGSDAAGARNPIGCGEQKVTEQADRQDDQMVI